MRIFDVEVLSYSDDEDFYTVQYCVESKPGIIRRSKAQYKNKELSRENDNDTLLLLVEEKVKHFNYKP